MRKLSRLNGERLDNGFRTWEFVTSQSFSRYVESGDLTHASMDTARPWADQGFMEISRYGVASDEHRTLSRPNLREQNEWTSDVFRKIDGERKAC
jgi:hypothetical protein